jgi:hypothetical protein
VDFHLSPAAHNVHEETCLCHYSVIYSGDATNKAVVEELETMRRQNKNAPLYLRDA